MSCALNVPLIGVMSEAMQPSGWDVEDLFNAGPLTAAVQTRVSHLQSDLMSYASGCKVSQLKIALVGYSMGAWVINEWLQKYSSERGR